MNSRRSITARRDTVAPVQLLPCLIHKPWGRRDLGEPFGNIIGAEESVGEIWFEPVDEMPAELLVKYLFTSQDLSVQVHPDDAAAHAAGLKGGKDEAWLILKAEPGAMIGLGLRAVMSKREVRAAALDGSLPAKMFWHVARPGSFFYVPAGTIHSIGAGITLIEIQQNVDVTYRLFDHGRLRELHIDEAVAAANPVPYVDASTAYSLEPGREILADGAAFVVERWSGDFTRQVEREASGSIWIVPVHGVSWLGTRPIQPGSAWIAIDDIAVRTAENSELLVAYAGHVPRRFPRAGLR